MKKIASFIVGLVICGLLTGQAYAAAPITPQGATELKKLVEDNLHWRLELGKMVGQGLGMDGAVTVTPESTFYEVTLAKTSLILGPQGKLDIGTVVFHATPGNAGEWLVSGALPASMTFYDKMNTPVAVISIEKQRFAGAWQPAREMWPRFDALYQNIRIKGVKADTPDASIGSLAAMMNLKDNNDGTWSGPSTFEASDIVLNVPAAPAVRMVVAKVTGGSAYERLDMSLALEVKKTFQEMLAATKPASDADIKERLSGILSRSTGAIDSMSSSFDMQGFSLHQDAAPPKPPVDFSLNRLSFLSRLQDARQEKSKVSFKSSFDGLKISAIPADFAGLTPQTFNLEINTDNLPIRKVMTMMTDSLMGATAASSQAAMKDVLSAMPKILQDNGVSVSVQNTYAKSADLSASLAGKIDANAAAVFGISGKMTLSLKGLESTLRKLGDLAVKPGADLRMMGVVSSLTTLQMMGQIDKAADGAPLRVYNFEITPDGKMLLNGVDFRAMAAFAGGHAPTAPAHPPVSPPK